MKNKLTCEEFFEKYFDNDSFNIMLEEMYWEKNFNAHFLFEQMKKLALNLGVDLVDENDWEYSIFFYNIYNNTEKGLS